MTAKKSKTKSQNRLTEHETVNHIGIVTMNNPKQLNTLSSEMVHELLDALDRFETRNMRAVILRASAGPRSGPPVTTSRRFPWTARIP
jgi:enoyl-CoA hydratase/carnithine racemase